MQNLKGDEPKLMKKNAYGNAQTRLIVMNIMSFPLCHSGSHEGIKISCTTYSKELHLNILARSTRWSLSFVVTYMCVSFGNIDRVFEYMLLSTLHLSHYIFLSLWLTGNKNYTRSSSDLALWAAFSLKHVSSVTRVNTCQLTNTSFSCNCNQLFTNIPAAEKPDESCWATLETFNCVSIYTVFPCLM